MPYTQLNYNLYFFLLSPIVSDAVARATKFERHTMLLPELSSAERVSRTASSNGMSVLVTSATDALAFVNGPPPCPPLQVGSAPGLE